MVVNEDFGLHVPDNLNLAGAAPLMCAGITVRARINGLAVADSSIVSVVAND